MCSDASECGRHHDRGDSRRESKQGRKGTHVLWILVVSLILALVACGAVEIYGRTTMDTGSTPPVTQPWRRMKLPNP
ncbi:hypothetical protein CYK37_18540 [Mesorhizobium loti]|nr:hypothetical protein CYK37_18540 [Mesorhizobium loti]